jgi:hypothetical protein
MVEQGRCAIVTIEQLLNVIPEEELCLKNILNDYKKSLWNKAPEVRRSSGCWLPLKNILEQHITDLEDDWKKQLLNIFNGQCLENKKIDI